MSLKKSAWGAAALAATLLLAACGGSGGSSPAPASGGDAAAGGTYGVSFDKMNAFREGEQKAMQAAAGELGVTLDLQVANTDAQRQSSQIESLISKGSKAVVSIPWDTQAVQADAEAAKAANIPFITFDQAPADLSWVTFHVGGDPLADGTAAGQFYCKAAGGQPFTLLEFQGSLNNDNGVEARARPRRHREHAVQDAGSQRHLRPDRRSPARDLLRPAEGEPAAARGYRRPRHHRVHRR
jgi:ABC-type sugar transport system substrate-binding protein